MPPLDNPRHERFAQELAKGKSASEAYVEAGYKEVAARACASRLLTKANIATRVAELQERGAKRVEITQERIRQMLEEDRELAKQCKQASAAVAASTALGKLFGHFIERAETVTLVKDITDRPLTDEEWAAQQSETAH